MLYIYDQIYSSKFRLRDGADALSSLWLLIKIKSWSFIGSALYSYQVFLSWCRHMMICVYVKLLSFHPHSISSVLLDVFLLLKTCQILLEFQLSSFAHFVQHSESFIGPFNHLSLLFSLSLFFNISMTYISYLLLTSHSHQLHICSIVYLP